jgi:hypothetical protein
MPTARTFQSKTGRCDGRSFSECIGLPHHVNLDVLNLDVRRAADLERCFHPMEQECRRCRVWTCAIEISTACRSDQCDIFDAFNMQHWLVVRCCCVVAVVDPSRERHRATTRCTALRQLLDDGAGTVGSA